MSTCPQPKFVHDDDECLFPLVHHCCLTPLSKGGAACHKCSAGSVSSMVNQLVLPSQPAFLLASSVSKAVHRVPVSHGSTDLLLYLHEITAIQLFRMKVHMTSSDQQLYRSINRPWKKAQNTESHLWLYGGLVGLQADTAKPAAQLQKYQSFASQEPA